LEHTEGEAACRLLRNIIMSLSDTDKEWIKMMGAEIAREVNEKVIEVHIQTCPYGLKLTKIICLGIGLCLGTGVASGSIVLGIARLVGI
jgi:hypothetical protein